MANPPSKVFPQDNYCFCDSSCRPCPSLFAQNILLPAIFLGQARATHVISSWACKQDKMDLKVSQCWAGHPQYCPVCHLWGHHHMGRVWSSTGMGCSGKGHCCGPGDSASAVVLENFPASVFSGKHYHQHILACNLASFIIIECWLNAYGAFLRYSERVVVFQGSITHGGQGRENPERFWHSNFTEHEKHNLGRL